MRISTSASTVRSCISLVRELVDAGVEVHLFQPPPGIATGIMHRKVMVIDGNRVVLRSANWSRRALEIYSEIAVEFRGSLARRIHQQAEAKRRRAQARTQSLRWSSVSNENDDRRTSMAPHMTTSARQHHLCSRAHSLWCYRHERLQAQVRPGCVIGYASDTCTTTDQWLHSARTPLHSQQSTRNDNSKHRTRSRA